CAGHCASSGTLCRDSRFVRRVWSPRRIEPENAMTIKAFVVRHAVAAYFALAFAISWGGILVVVGGAAGFRGTAAQSDPLFRVVYLAMLAGPSVAGLMLTAIVGGRTGLRDLLSRLLAWHVAARWYAMALLIAPVLIISTLLMLSLISP